MALALFFTSMLFLRCQRELSHIGGPDLQPSFPHPVTASIQGNVLDENGQPASGVTIKVGSKNSLTDNRGFFRIEEAGLDKNAALVTAEKPGYFKAYRTFRAAEGNNQVVIKLIEKNLSGSIDASTGGTVTVNSGMKVSVPANGVVLAANGSNYSGPVNVYAAFIDPTLPDIDKVLPGSFIADDINGDRVVLSSYGMMAVELESASGEKLQIRSGSKATLENAIPSSLLATAPATIPLWYVNESTGIWMEDGSAVRSGNNYVGEVSHFSFWNYDIPTGAFSISMVVKNADGLPMVHARVRLRTVTSSPVFMYGYTNDAGFVSGWAPKNVALRLDVLDECHGSVLSRDLDPMNRDTDLGTLTVSASSTSVVTIKGKLLNCASGAVTNGTAIVEYGNAVHFAEADANGNFTTNFTRCTTSPASFQVTGIDETALQQGAAVTGNISGTVNDIGNIAACGTSIDQYINYTIDGINTNLSAPADSLTAFTFPDSSGQFISYISGVRMQSGAVVNYINFQFKHPVQSAGTYAVFNLSTSSFSQTTPQSLNVTLTNYPASVGQFYEGTISGTFNSGSTHSTSGTFRIRRKQ